MDSIQSLDLESFKTKSWQSRPPGLTPSHLWDYGACNNARLQCKCNFPSRDSLDFLKSRFFTWSRSRVSISTVSKPESWQSRPPGLTPSIGAHRGGGHLVYPLIRLWKNWIIKMQQNTKACSNILYVFVCFWFCLLDFIFRKSLIRINSYFVESKKWA
jgi:hypothetical protein